MSFDVSVYECHSYSPVNVDITMENHIVFVGKLTVSMVIFNGKLLVYRRVHGKTTSKKTWMIESIRYTMFLELSIPISYTFGLIPERMHFFDEGRSSFLTQTTLSKSRSSRQV